MFYSPLRYPGGKNRLAKLISKICEINNINEHYIEPYAGGASVALHLLIEKKVKKITINDYDRSIYAFWYAILNHTKEFCMRIEHTEVTLENWYKAKALQKNKQNEKLLDLGFSTFFLNRTNVSGILNGGMIGGTKQQGQYKIDCRFNKKALIEKILLIASHKQYIHLYNLDALDLIKKVKRISKNTGTVFYFDPPYYRKGASLYMNHYDDQQHKALSQEIYNIKNIHWIISYDDTPEIEKIYQEIPEDRKRKYLLTHSAYRSRSGKEILFFSKKLLFPNFNTENVEPGIIFSQASL